MGLKSTQVRENSIDILLKNEGKLTYVQNGFWTRDKCVLSFSRDHAVNPENVHSMFSSFGSLFSYLPSARNVLPF